LALFWTCGAARHGSDKPAHLESTHSYTAYRFALSGRNTVGRRSNCRHP
jgi:hypothetical protein